MTTQPQQAELDTDTDDLGDLPAAEASLLPRVAVELFGTFVLVTAIVVTTAFGTLGASSTPLHIALAGGLALAAMVVVFGAVSGAHLNPAVSLAATIAGRLSWADLAPYIVAQTLGGVAAVGLLRVIVPATLPAALGQADVRSFISTTANGFGVHSPVATLSNGAVTFSTAHALIIEAVMTAVVAAVVLAATRRATPGAPFAIGATYTVAILVAAQVTNAAINPARATGAALFSDPWALEQLWLFWAAPLLGGAIAGLIALLIQRGSEPAAEWDEEDWDDEADDDGAPAAEPSPAAADPADDVIDLDEPEQPVRD